MQKSYIWLCDRLEWVLSRWWGGLGYALALVGTMLLSWEVNDRFTWLTNAMFVVLLIGNARRSDKALHVKVDTIDPDKHEHLEDEDETRIEEARNS